MREGGNYFQNNNNVLRFTHSQYFLHNSLIIKIINVEYFKVSNKHQTL